MDNEETIEEKQHYLREEIIDKGYDPDEFSTVMSKVKDLDLSTWTMKELTAMVNSFHHQQSTKTTIDINHYDGEQNFAAPLFSTTTMSKIEMKSPSTTTEGEVKTDNLGYVKCIKQEPNKLTQLHKLQIIISNPEYIKGGLFSFGYVQYTVSSPDIENNSIVVRVQDDFYWLRERLLNLYPATLFPPLPQSSIFKDKTNTEKMHKKVRILNRFMNSLAQNELIRSSSLFFNFITLTKDQFASIKKEYSKSQTPNSMNKFITMDGILLTGISKDKLHKADPISKDINNKLPLFKALNYAIKNLLNEFDVISAKFKEVAGAFENLGNAYAINPNQEYIKNAFVSLGNMTFNWSQSYLNQKDFFKVELKEFFKYMQRELRVLNTLTEQYELSRNLFFEESKERHQLHNDNDSQSDNSNDASDFIQTQRTFGFILNRINSEYLQINLLHSDRLRLLFILLNDYKKTFLSDYVKMIEFLSPMI